MAGPVMQKGGVGNECNRIQSNAEFHSEARCHTNLEEPHLITDAQGIGWYE